MKTHPPPAGVPDIIICYKGYFLGVECKTKKGRVSELQKATLFLIQKAGGHAIIARSLDDVKEELNAIDQIADGNAAKKTF